MPRKIHYFNLYVIIIFFRFEMIQTPPPVGKKLPKTFITNVSFYEILGLRRSVCDILVLCFMFENIKDKILLVQILSGLDIKKILMNI